MKEKKGTGNGRSTAGILSGRNTVFLYGAAFAVPFLILFMAFILLRIYPFGDRQILVVDAWNQYYPFLVELARKLKGGESLLYSWRMGLGSDFVSLIAYYLASPLNLLVVLFPEGSLREVFTLFLLMKTGFAGCFCAFSLCRIHQKKENSVVIFSTFYALCGWTIGYYWNIMWLDTFAVLPLVGAGIVLLVREKRYRLYTISLAAAILMNYYIGLMVCIFTALFFFVQCAVCKNGRKELLRNLRNIILFSLLAILISAVATLPTLAVLQNAYKSSYTPSRWYVTRGWLETLSHTLAYVKPTATGGNPYLYCGVLSILLLLVFYRLSGVSLREKAAYTAAVLFVFASTNINVLDYIWHGFHVTNSLPYRYVFLFAFLMVLVAYRAYAGMEQLQKKDGLFLCGMGALYYFLVAADRIHRYQKEYDLASALTGLRSEETESGYFLLKNFLLLAGYLLIIQLLIRKKLRKSAATLLLAVLAAAELVPSVTGGIEAVGTTDRSSYPGRYGAVKEALADMENGEGDNVFYRTEFIGKHGWNDPALYGYNGTAIFSSTANVAVTRLFEQMGQVAWQAANRCYALDSTPVNNAFLNLKYFLSGGGEAVDQEYLTEIGRAEDVRVYQNEAYLPVGFMVEGEMADFAFEGQTPFEMQNALLKTAAGTDEDVFEALDMIHVGHQNLYVTRKDYGRYQYQPSEDAAGTEPGRFKYNYEMPEDGCVYAFLDLRPEGRAENTASVVFDGNVQDHIIYENGTFFPAGSYKKGDIFSVCSEIAAGSSGDLRMYVSIFHPERFDRAYERLQDEVLEVTQYTSRSLKGTVTVKKSSLLYTSIPYEKGWKVYVDGRKSDITLIADALIGVELAEGEHTIEFRYVPVQVYLSLLLSLMGVGGFILMLRMDRRGHMKWL